MLLHVSIDVVSKRGSSHVYTSKCYYMLVLIFSTSTIFRMNFWNCSDGVVFFILLEELLDFFLLVTISLLTDQEGEQQL